MATSSLSKYLEFMRKSLDSMREMVVEDGYVGLVIGDVRRGKSQLKLAHLVRDEVAIPSGCYCHGVISDRLPTAHKVSRIWKSNTGRATQTDRILLLSPSKSELPPLGSVHWGSRHFRTWRANERCLTYRGNPPTGVCEPLCRDAGQSAARWPTGRAELLLTASHLPRRLEATRGRCARGRVPAL
jgi:hypothetical protein